MSSIVLGLNQVTTKGRRVIGACRKYAAATTRSSGGFGRNRNVHQEEQAATAENIFNHYGLLGPLPLIDGNEAHFALQAFNMSRNVKNVGDHHMTFKAHLLFPWIYDLVTNRMLVASVQSVLGPNVLITNSAIHSKAARSNQGAVPWNQMSADWSQEDTASPSAVVHIALTDSNINNGGYRIVPASHLEKEDHIVGFENPEQVGPTFSKTRLEKQDEIEGKAVGMPLDAGEAVLFHPALVHASGNNESDKQHAILSVCFAPTSAKPLSSGNWGQTALLVAGEDQYKNFELIQRRPKSDLDEEGLEIHTREVFRPLP